MPTTDLRQNIDTSWQNLQQALAGIPDDRMSETGVCGEWSTKDLLAHIAFWDDLDVEQIKARSIGAEIQPVDWQAANDKSSAERADWSLSRARQEFEDAHARLLALCADHPGYAAEIVDKDTWEHYDEHAAQIREWRQQQNI